MRHQVRCNSEDRCALCRIDVYIQAEDRTEKQLIMWRCADPILTLGRYLFSRSASACTVDVKTCPLSEWQTWTNLQRVFDTPLALCSHVCSIDSVGCHRSVMRLKTTQSRRKLLPNRLSPCISNSFFCCVEALELALNPIPSLLNFHQFPDRHEEVDDWNDDCDIVGPCCEIGSRNDDVVKLLP